MSEGRFKEEQSRINFVRMEDVVGGDAEKSFMRKVDCQCFEDSWHYSCPCNRSSNTSCKQMLQVSSWS